MDDVELRKRLDELEKKIDDTFRSAERTRMYLKWAGIVSIILLVLPIIGIFFELPQFVSLYSNYTDVLQ